MSDTILHLIKVGLRIRYQEKFCIATDDRDLHNIVFREELTGEYFRLCLRVGCDFYDGEKILIATQALTEQSNNQN